VVEIKSKLGQRIRLLREAQGLSQKNFAYASDLDRSYIASVENGQRNISIVNIDKIVKALGISIQDFFNDETFAE
jgi:transcriptional regulator with XRE-family HTH domain